MKIVIMIWGVGVRIKLLVRIYSLGKICCNLTMFIICGTKVKKYHNEKYDENENIYP